MLGVTDPDSLPDSQHLSNVLAMLYSTISKTINRKASGYGLLMTAVARDGGMREDSMKLLSNLCHPRTAQKYDTEVLGKDWDSNLNHTPVYMAGGWSDRGVKMTDQSWSIE